VEDDVIAAVRPALAGITYVGLSPLSIEHLESITCGFAAVRTTNSRLAGVLYSIYHSLLTLDIAVAIGT